MEIIEIKGQRLWNSLMEMAEIGATHKGGVCRLALTDLDRQARDLFVRWCTEAGCRVRVDRMGNIFARRHGRDNSLPPVLTGSHLDSQPTGGRFDGVYGVLAGLEVIRTLNDLDYQTESPVEICSWTNEEGARFPPAMIASGVFGGVFTLEEGLGSRDVNDATLGEELRRIGYDGAFECGGRELRAYIELHIEQGPILESENTVIGVVEGVQGIRWFDVTLEGMETHAGTTPMERRQDALAGAASFISAVQDLADEYRPDARATIGTVEVHPNSRNVIPGRVRLSLDLRHPDGDALDDMTLSVRRIAMRIARIANLTVDVEQIWDSPPVVFDTECVSVIRQAADSLQLSNRLITSGAGHDAVHVACVAPTGMIFIPCEGGISHNESESATPADITAGCNVLLNTVISFANRRPGSDAVVSGRSP